MRIGLSHETALQNYKYITLTVTAPVQFGWGCVLCIIRGSKNSKNIFHHVPSLECGVTGIELTLVNQQ